MGETEVIEVASGGVMRFAGAPEHGRQDLGYSPGGAQDRFSLETGNILLGQDPGSPALEMVVPAPIRFRVDCCFVLTGGALGSASLDSPRGSRLVGHGEVTFAPSGSRLSFGERSYGFRTYLGFRPAPKDWERLAARKRGGFADIARWPDPDGRIRVLAGPEHRVLREPDIFFQSPWKTTADVSDMGLRLDGGVAVESMVDGGLESMVSGPVADGTIQLTPKGPIVLLRRRQTVGGYPRIFNVISADVDILAQFGPFQRMRFRLISVEEAWKIARVRRDDIEKLKERCRG